MKINSIVISSSIILGFLLSSCSGSQEIAGFDSSTWQEDVMGCKSKRIQLVEGLIEQKAELTGLGQEEIKSILGKPDRHELYSRNKKAFVYFVTNGPDCTERVEQPSKLVIRFDGLGRSKDIIYYQKEVK